MNNSTANAMPKPTPNSGPRHTVVTSTMVTTASRWPSAGERSPPAIWRTRRIRPSVHGSTSAQATVSMIPPSTATGSQASGSAPNSPPKTLAAPIQRSSRRVSLRSPNCWSSASTTMIDSSTPTSAIAAPVPAIAIAWRSRNSRHASSRSAAQASKTGNSRAMAPTCGPKSAPGSISMPARHRASALPR